MKNRITPSNQCDPLINNVCRDFIETYEEKAWKLGKLYVVTTTDEQAKNIRKKLERILPMLNVREGFDERMLELLDFMRDYTVNILRRDYN